jgi:hypothetical protein
MIVGVLWGYHNYQATGFLLPATFYLKRNFVHIDQVHSVWVGLSAIVDRIPPFWAHAVWLSLGGFLILGEIRKMGPRTILPILGGLLFLAGNLVVVPPLDPSSFYHIRYIMPAIPLLISGCAVGLLALVRFLHGNARIAAAIFLVTGIVGCAATLPHASARLHNDIRNINEVQVAMGEWVGAHTGPQAWIATSDAGAVRYFSNRPSIDLMGLNTPEVLVGGEEWVKARPARILTFMPSWFQPVHQKLGTIREFTTEPYTVTKWPQMATQIAAVCLADTNAAIVRVDLAGVRSVRIYCVPFREH